MGNKKSSQKGLVKKVHSRVFDKDVIKAELAGDYRHIDYSHGLPVTKSKLSSSKGK